MGWELHPQLPPDRGEEDAIGLGIALREAADDDLAALPMPELEDDDLVATRSYAYDRWPWPLSDVEVLDSLIAEKSALRASDGNALRELAAFLAVGECSIR